MHKNEILPTLKRFTMKQFIVWLGHRIALNKKKISKVIITAVSGIYIKYSWARR